MKVELPENGFAQVAFELQNGMYVPEQYTAAGGPQPEVDRDLYLKNFEFINDTYGIATDPETGTEFEVAATNLDKMKTGNVVVFYSTDFSSLSQNIGNAIELAGMAAANPNTCYIYVGYPGNGLSQDMSDKEKKYYKQTGRLTFGVIPEGETYATPETYTPLQHMEAMDRAVVTHFEVDPEHISADKSGARLALGAAAAAKENSLKDGYLNNPVGLAEEAAYGQTTELVYQTQSRASRYNDPEYVPGKVTGKTKAEATPLMPRIYGDGNEHEDVVRDTYLRALNPHGGNFWMNRGVPLVPFTRGALKGHDNLKDLPNHAVFNDLMAALMRHEFVLSLQANTKDAKTYHKTMEAIITLGSTVMNHIHPSMRSENRGVEFRVLAGKPEAHTDNPASRLASERVALSKIATFMRLVFSGEPGSMVVTQEDIILEDAA